MALGTLENVKEINDVKIINLDQAKQMSIFKINGLFDWNAFDEYRKDHPISVSHSTNMISFKIQDGPIKEVGKNGCQVADMIAVARHIINELNIKYPCRENAMTITKLDEALMWQAERTRNRVERNVEGTSNA